MTGESSVQNGRDWVIPTDDKNNEETIRKKRKIINLMGGSLLSTLSTPQSLPIE